MWISKSSVHTYRNYTRVTSNVQEAVRGEAVFRAPLMSAA